MSTTVDERVVSLKFDNREFEKNVSTTMSTLDKFKQKLNFKGTSQGMEEVGKAANKIDMSGLGKGIETVHAKFSALQVMGITALTNITNSAVNAGKRIASALTIDPIKTGFQEYETQINAVQTILANTESKGSTLQDVNSALDELNTYADKTIYNFTEMTRNIGTFTAAGVDLDTSVSAIKGIANLAAVSGSSSMQASTAMYQLSQALAAGRVSLMDWNSVVNAGMGGQVFQDALKRTSEIMGTGAEAAIKANGSFRESLTKGEWLTTEVLTETLYQFTMAAEEGTEQWENYKKSLMEKGYSEKQALDILKMANTATDAATKVKTFTQLIDTLKESVQSGWTQSWEILLGDFGEAKELFTEISDRLGGMIGASAESRNAMLSGGLSSGWKQLLSAGIADEEGYKESIKAVAKEHKISIDNMIKEEQKLDKTLTDSEAFDKALVKGLKNGTINSDMLSKSVHNLADKMKKMSAKEREAAGYTEEHVEQIIKLSKGLKDGSISMDDFVKKMMRPSGRENIIQALWNSFNALVAIIKPVREAFREIFPPITGEQLYSFTEKLVKLTEKFTISAETADKIKRTFKGVFSIFSIGIEVVKGLLGRFVDFIGVVAPAGGFILDITARIGDFFTSLNTLIKSPGGFDNLTEKFKETKTWSKYLEPVMKHLDKFKTYFKSIADSAKEFGDKVADAFSKLGNSAQVRFDALGMLGDLIKTIFMGLFKMVGAVLPIIPKITEGLGKLIGLFAEAFQSGDFTKAFDFINGGIFATIGIYIAKFIKSLGDFTGDGGDIVANIKELLEGVGDALNAFTASMKAKTLKDIATSIAILAGSLAVLALIKPERLTSALVGLSVLFMLLSKSITSFMDMAKAKEFGQIAKVAGLLTSLAISVLILSAAMKILATLSWGEIFRGLVATAGGLSALILAINALPDNEVNKSVKAIGKLSKSLIIFSVAMKILATLTWDDIFRGLVATTGGLSAMVLAVNALPNEWVGSAAKAIGKLSGALVIFSVAMKILATLTWDDIFRGLVATVGGLSAMVLAVNALPNKWIGSATKDMILLSGALVIFSVAMKSLSLLSWMGIAKGLTATAGGLGLMVGAMHLLPKDVFGKATGMLIFSAALVVLGEAMNSLSSFSWTELAIALSALAGSLLVISGAMFLMKGAIPGAFALSVVTGSLLLLIPVLGYLSSMSIGEIGKSLGTLAIGLGILVAAGMLLQPLIGTLLALSGSMALFGTGMLALGLGVAALGVGLTAISTVLATTGASIAVFIGSLIGLIPFLIKQIGVGIIELLKIVAGSGAALFEAAKTIIVSLVDALVASVPALVDGALVLIDELLKSLAEHIPSIVVNLCDLIINLLNALSDKMPDLVKAGANVLLSIFKGSVEALKGMDTSGLLEGMLAVGLMVAITMRLASIVALTPAAMLGVLSLGAVIAELTLVLAAVGKLSQIDGLESLIKDGGNFLQTVGTAIGQFVGGIVGGIAKGVAEVLPEIGQALSGFMVGASPFIAGVKMVDESVIIGAGAMCAAILALTTAELFTSISSFLSGGVSLPQMGADLSEFMINATPFILGAKLIDESLATSMTALAKSILVLTAADVLEGLTAWFTGGSSLADFGKEIASFGPSLAEFGKSVTGINPEVITAAANAAKTLAEMASMIPNEGGIVAWFSGENSMAAFAPQMVVFGASLKAFSLTVAGIDPEPIKMAAEAGKAIINMSNNIPNEGGIKAWFAGDNSMATFAPQMVSLGKGLKSYAASVEGLNIESITKSVTAVDAIVKLSNKIPDNKLFKNETTIDEFGDKLPALAKGLSSYSSNLGNIDTGKLNTSITAVDKLVKMAKGLSDFDSGSIKGFNKALGTMAKNGIKDFKNAFKDSTSEAKKAIEKMISECVKAAESKDKDFKKAGKKLSSSLIDGIKDKKKDAKSAAKDLANDAADAAGSAKSGFKTAGKDAAEGFASGISANSFSATAKAKAMAKSALEAAKKALDINSPSKEAAKLGEGVPEGLALGIDRMTGLVGDSATSMANTTLDTTSKIISDLGRLIDSDVDYQPTIRPVVDLSDVESSAGSINGLFGLNPSIGLLADVSSINGSINARLQNGSNSDVISAIESLGKTLSGNTSGNTYNINGITYDDGSNVSNAVSALVRAARIERRM